MKNLLILLLLAISACNAGRPDENPSPQQSDHHGDASCCLATPHEHFNTGTLVTIMAKETEQADLAVDTVNTTVECKGDIIVLRAFVVGMGNDDCSSCSKIIVGLPAEVEVLSFKAKGNGTGPISTWHACTNNAGQTGMITVDVPGYICKDSNAQLSKSKPYKWDHVVEIVCEVRASPNPIAKCKESLSVYAMSSVPDTEPNNNYWHWRRGDGPAPCNDCPTDN
jgi:hypothetical protein